MVRGRFQLYTFSQSVQRVLFLLPPPLPPPWKRTFSSIIKCRFSRLWATQQSCYMGCMFCIGREAEAFYNRCDVVWLIIFKLYLHFKHWKICDSYTNLTQNLIQLMMRYLPWRECAVRSLLVPIKMITCIIAYCTKLQTWRFLIII